MQNPMTSVANQIGSLIRLRGPSSLRGRDPRVVGSFGVVDLARDLGTGACAHKRAREFVLCGSAARKKGGRDRGVVGDRIRAARGKRPGMTCRGGHCRSAFSRGRRLGLRVKLPMSQASSQS